MFSYLRHAFCLMGFCAVLFAQVSSPTGIVEGDVNDSTTNKPIAGARVRLQAGALALFSRCDANGHFEFQGVPFGTHAVTVERPGYTSASGKARLSPNRIRAEVHVSLQPYAVISGKITDSAGAPLEGVNVELLTVRRRKYLWRLPTSLVL